MRGIFFVGGSVLRANPVIILWDLSKASPPDRPLGAARFLMYSQVLDRRNGEVLELSRSLFYMLW